MIAGRQYFPAIRSLADRFEVRAICEQVSLRATVQRLNFMLKQSMALSWLAANVDAVLCLGDQWYGTAPILAACDAGTVYSAASLPACRGQLSQLFSRVESSGVAFMAELTRRHAPATIRLKSSLPATRTTQDAFCQHRLPSHPIRASGLCRTAGGGS